MNKIETCSVQELNARIARAEARILDVREYPEYVESSLPMSRLIPLGELKLKPELAGEGEVLLLCRTGRRAREAAELLLGRQGVRPVVVEGGIEAWKQAGYPTRKEKGPISLERQVRIAAGALVLLGLLTPGLWPLPYLIGAGLVFAGVTDTCAMGLLLARLPWNRVKRPAPHAGQR